MDEGGVKIIFHFQRKKGAEKICLDSLLLSLSTLPIITTRILERHRYPLHTCSLFFAAVLSPLLLSFLFDLVNTFLTSLTASPRCT